MSVESGVLIIDNGAGSIKAGFVEQDAPLILPNATAKVQKSMQYLISDQIEQFNNGSLLQFIRPFDRGYLNNWQCEIEVWTRLFNEHCRLKPQETSLVVTEPPLNPTSLQNDANEVIYEYFGFKECLRRPTMWFSAYGCVNTPTWKQMDKFPSCSQSCTVIDSGFSFTHVAPFINMKCQKHCVSFINVPTVISNFFYVAFLDHRFEESTLVENS
jgi:actin-related protein 6